MRLPRVELTFRSKSRKVNRYLKYTLALQRAEGGVEELRIAQQAAHDVLNGGQRAEAQRLLMENTQ